MNNAFPAPKTVRKNLLADEKNLKFCADIEVVCLYSSDCNFNSGSK